ncbi:hypothetical protein [Frigoriglobus tundricola]|uniref:DUF1877 family protein n=1 Tax=Frigoriglobus tundricola TaxID=2774151 RepID=A0A6M5YKF5_9BACT|nr:hypothetical protein [Frigoriglobus tundricola]QJW93763.1 hypothetical protein FTUN_1274 [Frigoriglobus tundricola]
MSQWASMTVLPAEDFARLQADRDAPVSGDRERFDLHPLWYNFHELYRDEPGPLRFIVQGDVAERPIEWCLGVLPDQPEDEGDGTYYALVSPPTVAAIVAAIRAFPPGEVIGRLRKSRPGWVQYKKGRDDFSTAFEGIARAYAVAAAQRAGLTILVC